MTNLKFDIDGKKISSQDINSKKDFEGFYKCFQIKNKSFYQKNWFWSSIGFASIAITLILMLENSKNNQNHLKKDNTLILSCQNTNSVNNIKNKQLNYKTTLLNKPFSKYFFSHAGILLKTEYNFCCTNEKWNHLKKDSIKFAKNEKPDDKEFTTPPKISRINVITRDNLIKRQASKVPKYYKQKKRRIQIQK